MSLRENGLEEKIKEYGKNGTIIGICGGYQMLGNTIKDPFEVESNLKKIEGMKLLDVDTVFEEEKITTRVKAHISSKNIKSNIFKYCPYEVKDKAEIYGYEIHMGICSYGNETEALFNINNKNGQEVSYKDGAINKKGNIMGTYIHGIFDSIYFRQFITNMLREKKGIKSKKSSIYENLREKELDKLAEIVRNSVNIKAIYNIMGITK